MAFPPYLKDFSSFQDGARRFHAALSGIPDRVVKTRSEPSIVKALNQGGFHLKITRFHV